MATRGVNRVTVLGNLGDDPEVRERVTRMRVATSESWNDKNGNKQEKTEWHRVVIFGKNAEVAGKYLKKGSQVYLEGKLETSKWQDKEGRDNYTTEIILDAYTGVLKFIGGGSNGSSEEAKKEEKAKETKKEGDDFDDDIPY